MNTSEHHSQDDRPPAQLMSDAERGFGYSHAFAPLDADHLRAGAADMFEEGAGELLHAKLTELGFTDGQIERLAAAGLLEEMLARFAPDEMREIRQWAQRIIAADPLAQRALEDGVYATDKEQGRTGND